MLQWSGVDAALQYLLDNERPFTVHWANAGFSLQGSANAYVSHPMIFTSEGHEPMTAQYSVWKKMALFFLGKRQYLYFFRVVAPIHGHSMQQAFLGPV